MSKNFARRSFEWSALFWRMGDKAIKHSRMGSPLPIEALAEGLLKSIYPLFQKALTAWSSFGHFQRL